MALGGGGHVFHAVVDNFYGFARLHREKRGVGGDHRGVFFFAAESAAGFYLDDADAIGGQVEKFQESFVNVVGALERTPDGEPSLRVEGRDHAIIFDVELFLRAGSVFGFDNVGGVLPDRIDFALFD